MELVVLTRSHFDKLIYLIELAEEKNLTRTAEKLFMSQPALTAYINRVEKKLGVKLFDRTVSPIEVTPAGSYYMNEMKKLYAQEIRILDEIAQMDYAQDTILRIGIGRNRGNIWLPHILPVAYKKFPDSHIRIVEDRDERMISKLIYDQLDIAVTETFIYDGALVYQPLPDELHTLIASPRLPEFEKYDLSKSSRFNPLDIPSDFLDGQTFICPSVNGELNFYTQQLFNTYRILPKEIMFISNLSTAYQLAVKGVGVSFLSTNYADTTRTEEAPVFLMPGGKPTVRKIYLVYSKKNMSELKKFIIAETKEIMTRVQNERYKAAMRRIQND